MIVRYMLDTNMLSYIVKRRSPAARARFLALGSNEIACISTITEAEARYGLSRRPDATAFNTLMERFLAGIPVLPWSRDEAEVYGRLRAKLERNGLSLGDMDMLIAAHAIATGSVLVTNDRAFAQVDELFGIANWATDL